MEWPAQGRGSGRTPRFLCAAGCTVALAACAQIADQGLAARAGPWRLSEDRLAELLVAAQPFPLEASAARELARHWEAAAAFALQWTAGDSLLARDAAEIAAWPERRAALLQADLEARLGAQAAVSSDSAAALFEDGDLRLVAHVLRRAPEDAPANLRTVQRRSAQRILDELAAGGSWTQAVAQSDDEQTRDRSGVLGVTAQGELPPSLDRAAFRLAPGEASPVVQSAEGFHVVYRPRFEEIPLLFARGVSGRRLARLGEQADEEARRAQGLKARARAAEVLARIARAPGRWLRSDQPLASWQDGALRADVASRVLLLLGEEARAGLAEAGESERTQFVERMAVEEMRLAAAVANGAALPPDMAGALERDHAEEVEYWTLALGLADPGAPSRDALARHMDELVSRRGQARTLPPLLAAWLAAKAGTRLREEGVLAAVAKAKRTLGEPLP